MIHTFILTRECGLAHKTIVFVLEEFDLFTEVMPSSEEENFPKYTELLLIYVPITYVIELYMQGKQRLLYSLLDAMQSVLSQAVVVGVSCRLVSWSSLSIYMYQSFSLFDIYVQYDFPSLTCKIVTTIAA